MTLFGNRKHDDTKYGSSARKSEYMARNGIQQGVTDPRLVRWHESRFKRMERKAAKRAKRRNGGSPF